MKKNKKKDNGCARCAKATTGGWCVIMQCKTADTRGAANCDYYEHREPPERIDDLID